MGDKNLKAIAVRGSKDIQIARPMEFMEHCNEALKYIKHRDKNPIPGVMPILAGLGSPQEMAIHDEQWHTENFMWGNARERRKGFWTEEIQEQWTDTMETMRTRLLSCHNCPMKCGASIAVDKRFCSYMMKCFSKLTYTMGAYSDLDFGLRIAQKATEHGVDAFSAPQTMAFAIELYEAGILTDEDMPGFPPDSEGRFYWLLDRIVRREGIGDVLADGTYWAAKKIGNGRGGVRPQQHQEDRAAAAQARNAQPDLLPHVLHRREDQHHPDRRELPPGALPHQGGARGLRGGLAPRSRREVQGVVRGVGASGRQVDPELPADRSDLRDRGLAGEDALHRRQHRDVRRVVVLPAEASLPHPQSAGADLVRGRVGSG